MGRLKTGAIIGLGDIAIGKGRLCGHVNRVWGNSHLLKLYLGDWVHMLLAVPRIRFPAVHGSEPL